MTYFYRLLEIMLLRLFKSNQNIINVLALFITILLWLPSYSDRYLLNGDGYFGIVPGALNILVGSLFVIVQSIFLNYLSDEFKLLNGSSHLVCLMMLILNSSSYSMLIFNKVLVANTFVLLSLYEMLRLYNTKKSYYLVFNAGFLVSLASIFYLPCLLFMVLLIIVLIYIITPGWRDFVIAFLGAFTPFIYFFTYKFLSGGIDISNFVSDFSRVFTIIFSQRSIAEQMFFLFLILLTIVAVFHLLVTIGSKVVRVRKMQIIVLLGLLIGLSTLLVNKFDYISTLILTSGPVSILIANFFQNIRKNWLAELIFSIMISFIILGHIYFL